MSVPAQGSILSFAEQLDKVGADGTFDASALTWYKIRTGGNSLGVIQDQQVFPLETGGPLTPTDAYKQAKLYGGQVEMIPRLEDTMGHIFKAALGHFCDITGHDADNNVVANVHTHIFNYDSTNPAYQPWMALRRVVPGAITADNNGETGFDCKINSLRLNVPPMGKISMAMACVGRDAAPFDDASAWTYGNADFEKGGSAPDAGRGSLKIGSVSYPITGLAVDIANNLSRPEQEMINGSFNPDDFVALSRNVTIRFVLKWNNPQLWRKVFTNSGTGTVWDSLPFIVDKSGAGYAFDARYKSPALIPGTAVPYELRIRAGRVTVAVDGPIGIQPGNIVSQAFTCTLLEPAAGEDYVQIVVVNGKTSYA